MMCVASLLVFCTLALASPEEPPVTNPTDKTHEAAESVETEPSPPTVPVPEHSPAEGSASIPTDDTSEPSKAPTTHAPTASAAEAAEAAEATEATEFPSGIPATGEPHALPPAAVPSASTPPPPVASPPHAEEQAHDASAASASVSGTSPAAPSPTVNPSTPPPAAVTASPDWLEALVAAPAPAPAPTASSPAFLPLPSELMARGPAVAAIRFLWFLAMMLLSQLSLRVASRRPRGPLRLFLLRVVALSRALAALAILGTILALMPTKWLPWVGLVAASAAVAVGWSLRPVLSDGLSGLYLGIIGRHSPGTLVQMPDSRGIIHTPGPFRTVVRTESGALRTVPNRQLVTESREAALDGRTAITVLLNIPGDPPPRVGLAAIQWACTLLPWTGEEPAKVRPPIPGAPPEWTVEMVVLGNAPPVAEIRAVFFDLVTAILDRSAADAEHGGDQSNGLPYNGA